MNQVASESINWATMMVRYIFAKAIEHLQVECSHSTSMDGHQELVIAAKEYYTLYVYVINNLCWNPLWTLPLLLNTVHAIKLP